MMNGTEPERLGVAAERALASVERIMQRRRADTETLRSLWNDGELPRESLPCHNACEGQVRVRIDAQTVLNGFCPAHMVEGVCPLTLKAERELAARMKLAGFGARYQTADPERIRPRADVEEWLRDVPDHLKTGRGLLMAGDVGVGKTMILGYLGKQLLQQNVGVWKVHMPTFIEEVNDRSLRKGLVERAIKVDVLMLDDFGSGDMPPWVLGIIEGIVEHRYAHCKPMIVTTNLPRDVLVGDQAFRRMVDRWREACKLVQIGGTSQRHDD